jgi:peptidoglycan/xylan/chitin deacetylase (PgdA/CDA1 family)
LTFDDISPSYLTSSELTQIIDFFNDLNVACTFFVVPDNNMLRASEEFKATLRYAMSCGHEIALHGYMHRKNEFGILYPLPLPIPIPSLGKQKELIRKGVERLFDLIKIKPEGFRAPFYMHNSNTTRALAELGFKYDSSATVFKTTHCSSFRIKWLDCFGPFITSGIIEIPVTGDYTYNLGNYGFTRSLKIAMRDFDLTMLSSGVFVINNHPNCLYNNGAELLKVLIKKLEGLTTFAKLVDITCVRQSRLDSSNCERMGLKQSTEQ